MSQGFAKTEFADPGWQDWSPSYTNITIGNGTVVSRYQQIGTTVHVYFRFVLGSTSSIGGNTDVSLPVDHAAGYGDFQDVVGQVMALRGATMYHGFVRLGTGSNVLNLDLYNPATTYLERLAFSATAPQTWTTSDTLGFSATYEAATSALIGMGLNNDHGALSGLTDDDHSAYPAYAEYQDWVPTYTGFTIGNGTLNMGRYIQIGKFVHCYLKFTLGSTSAVTGDINVSVPVSPNTIYDSIDSVVGEAKFQDGAASRIGGTVSMSGDTHLLIRPWLTNVQYLTESGLSATIPFTWASGDMFALNATYEAATAV